MIVKHQKQMDRDYACANNNKKPFSTALLTKMVNVKTRCTFDLLTKMVNEVFTFVHYSGKDATQRWVAPLLITWSRRKYHSDGFGPSQPNTLSSKRHFTESKPQILCLNQHHQEQERGYCLRFVFRPLLNICHTQKRRRKKESKKRRWQYTLTMSALVVTSAGWPALVLWGCLATMSILRDWQWARDVLTESRT